MPLLGVMGNKIHDIQTKLVITQWYSTYSQNGSGMQGDSQSGSQIWRLPPHDKVDLDTISSSDTTQYRCQLRTMST